MPLDEFRDVLSWPRVGGMNRITLRCHSAQGAWDGRVKGDVGVGGCVAFGGPLLQSVGSQ
jgi:hypothetical protein